MDECVYGILEGEKGKKSRRVRLDCAIKDAPDCVDGQRLHSCHKMVKLHGKYVPTVGTNAQVYHGEALRTKGGLCAEDIIRREEKNGDSVRWRYVPKCKSEAQRENLWIQAVRDAREELDLGGFVKLDSKAPRGTDSYRLYHRAKEIHSCLKAENVRVSK